MPFQLGGDGPSNTQETLRNYRWLIERLGPVNRDQCIIAKDLQLPDLVFDQAQILGGQNYYKYAKATKWSDIKVSFYDDGKWLDEINKWRRKIYDVGTGIKKHDPESGYKSQCVFHLFDGCGEVVNTVTLHGAWPSTISLGQLSYSDTGLKLISLTLSYDWADLDSQSSPNAKNESSIDSSQEPIDNTRIRRRQSSNEFTISPDQLVQSLLT